MFLVAVPSPSYLSRPTLLILPQPLTVFSLSYCVTLIRPLLQQKCLTTPHLSPIPPPKSVSIPQKFFYFSFNYFIFLDM